MNDALVAVLMDVERHVKTAGWDQPARMFALVETRVLVEAEPSLVETLGDPDARPDGALSAVEQDEFHAGHDLVGDLERISWPEGVAGCALSVERLFVPAHVEPLIPEDPDEAADFVAQHPERQDIRVVVGVMRDGQTHGIARVKSSPDDLLAGAELVPGLAKALARTFE